MRINVIPSIYDPNLNPVLLACAWLTAWHKAGAAWVRACAAWDCAPGYLKGE